MLVSVADAKMRVAQIHSFVIWGCIILIIQVLTSPVVFLPLILVYFLSFFLISSFYLDDFLKLVKKKMHERHHTVS